MPNRGEPQIFRPSYSSLHLRLFSGGQELGTATGFVVEHEGSPYLVTNSHVLAGKRPDTGELLDPYGRVPDSVRINHVSTRQDSDFVEREEPVADHNGVPCWYEHPVHGSKVDVVALPLSQLDEVYLSTYDPARPPYVQFGVGDEVSIVGFPFGVSTEGFAVWTRGTIASEYDIDYDGLPRYLIDARTRPGQSGSPVIFFRTGAYFGKFGGIFMNTMKSDHVLTPGQPIPPDQENPDDGFTEEFLGIYSGRIRADADLGFVWRPQALIEILTATAPAERSG